jgi:hypothetical protein
MHSGQAFILCFKAIMVNIAFYFFFTIGIISKLVDSLIFLVPTSIKYLSILIGYGHIKDRLYFTNSTTATTLQVLTWRIRLVI